MTRRLLVASETIRETSYLAFMLELVGSVRWIRPPFEVAPGAECALVVCADPKPIEVVAARAARWRDSGYEGPLAVVSEPAPEEAIAKYLHRGVDLHLPVTCHGWYFMASVGALLRRSRPVPERDDVISSMLGDVSGSLSLSPTETAILRCLVQNAGRWVSRTELFDAALGHGPRCYDDSAIRVHVHNIRRALGSEGSRIESKRGSGWRWR